MSIKKQRVFNYDFSTKALFRCIQRKYADDFVKGIIRFSKPINWIKMEENGNIGQGDILEGVSIAANIDDNSDFISKLKNNKNVDTVEKNNLIYFRNNNNINKYCLCLYGLNDVDFKHEYIDRFGDKHYYAKVEKNYFSTFNSISSEKEYFELDEKERPNVIFITNPSLFFDKIRKFFIDLGVDVKDIIILPVEYVDYNKIFLNNVPEPLELFMKDKYFRNQSEVRILINNTSKRLIDYMENNDWKIDIGDISDFTHIYDNYFNDLILEIRNNVLYFTLPFPYSIDIKNLTFNQLVNIYIQVINNKLPDKLTNEELKIYADSINNTIFSKYNILLSVEDNHIVCINNNKIDIADLIKNNK